MLLKLVVTFKTKGCHHTHCINPDNVRRDTTDAADTSQRFLAVTLLKYLYYHSQKFKSYHPSHLEYYDSSLRFESLFTQLTQMTPANHFT